MKKASIISIGNEVLSGETVDTNASYLGSRLFSLGIPVISSYTAVDQIDPIVRALKLACEDADIILVTGGLGPTDDDLTRQAFAKFLDAELQLQDELLQKIRDLYARLNKPMPDRNKSQAYIPAGTKALANNHGTAAGIMARTNGKLLFAMPGVPSEMKEMFEQSVLPQLETFKGSQVVCVKKLRCFGTGESNIAELLGDLCRRGRNPLINSTARGGVITLHIIATAENETRAQEMVQKDEKLLTDLLGDLIYGTGEQTLAEVVGQKLAQQKKNLATAESCTGGLLARLITDIPGASEYFTHGWITYSNTAKTCELGVQSELIEKYGAVSEQVARAMATGAVSKTEADFAIGITGIAGPDGGSKEKPVGLVYISIASVDRCQTQRFIFKNNRDSVRFRAAQTALNMLRLNL